MHAPSAATAGPAPEYRPSADDEPQRPHVRTSAPRAAKQTRASANNRQASPSAQPMALAQGLAARLSGAGGTESLLVVGHKALRGFQGDDAAHARTPPGTLDGKHATEHIQTILKSE